MNSVIENIDNAVAMSELKECLVKCTECSVVVSLKQFSERLDGGLNQIDINKEAYPVKSKININGEYIYLELSCGEDIINLKKIRKYWQTYNERGHARYMEGKANDYAVLIDLAKIEEKEGMAFLISFINPIFMGIDSDDKTLEMAIPLNSMRFEKSQIDVYAIDEEIKYEVEVEGLERLKTEPDEYGEKEEFDENDFVLSNDDVISNEDLLNLD